MGHAEILHDSRTSPRILVADADDDARSIYRESLIRAGCDVVVATDGRDALVKAFSQRPTLVITDTHLPIFDGYALCKELRRDSMTRGVPILVVTTETQPTELDRARKAGADCVVIKPVAPEVLLREIQRLLKPAEKGNEPGSTRQTADRVPSEQRRRSLAKAHLRFETTKPAAQPPNLVCPLCDGPLIYLSSHVGGVSVRYPEQWDRYTCPGPCGSFEYRHRTRKLRRI